MELPKYVIHNGAAYLVVERIIIFGKEAYEYKCLDNNGLIAHDTVGPLYILTDACKPVTKHIFTFGYGQEHAGKYQPIFARNAEEARHSMVAMYGSKWSMQYTEEQWDASVQRPGRWFPAETPLSYVIAPERD